MGFFTGTPARMEQVSTLDPSQMPLKQQLLKSAQGKGAGGAYGGAADYYYDTLSDDSKTFDAMAAPEMRRFNEQIVPDLAEQFAGMGSGALTGSGFRNAAVNAGTDLSERLGAIRAQLRQQAAQGLQNIGGQGLQSYNENVQHAAQPGFIDYAAPAAGAALTAFGGPVMGGLGTMTTNWLSNQMKPSTTTPPPQPGVGARPQPRAGAR